VAGYRAAGARIMLRMAVSTPPLTPPADEARDVERPRRAARSREAQEGAQDLSADAAAHHAGQCVGGRPEAAGHGQAARDVG
jgi:hypothetical protein